MISSLVENYSEDYCHGISALLFEASKHVKNRLHSRGVSILSELLTLLYQRDIQSDLYQDSLFKLVINVYTLIGHYVKKEHISPVWDLVLGQAEECLKDIEMGKHEESMKLGKLLAIINMLVAIRKGTKLIDFPRVHTVTEKACRALLVDSSKSHPTYAIEELLKLVSSTLLKGKLEDTLSKGKVILDIVFQYHDPVPIISLCFALARFEWSQYTQILLPYIVNFSSRSWNTHSVPIILLLSYLMKNEVLALSEGLVSSVLTQEGRVRFPKLSNNKEQVLLADGLLDIVQKERDWAKDVERFNEIDFEDSQNILDVALVSATLDIIPFVVIPFEKSFNAIKTLISNLTAFLSRDDVKHEMIKGSISQGDSAVSVESLLGHCLSALTIVAQKNGEKGIEALTTIVETVIDDILIPYGSCQLVVKGVASYLKAIRNSPSCKSYLSVKSLEKVYPHLLANISSVYQGKRLYTFEVLSIFEQFKMKSNDKGQLEDCDIFNQCLLIEQVSNSIHTYRDKLMYVRRVSLIVESGRMPEFYKEVAPRLALGLFTINLSLIWPEAISLAAKFAKVDSHTFWDIFHNEFSKFEEESRLLESGLTPVANDSYLEYIANMHHFEVAFKPVESGGLTFSCPAVQKLHKAFEVGQSFVKTDMAKSFLMEFISIWEPTKDHLDYWNYYSLIIKTLGEVPYIAEQHSRSLVPVFMKFVKEEYEAVFEQIQLHGQNAEEENEDMDVDGASERTDKGLVLEHSTKATKNKMNLYLQLFAKFKNPKSVYKSVELKTIYLSLLARGDAKIQLLALECVFTWKTPQVIPYADNLRNLLDDIKFRDELSTFSLDRESGSVDAAHRAELIPLLVRILYGRMIARKGKVSSKLGMAARRIAVLQTIAHLSEEELNEFIKLMLEPFECLNSTPGIVDGKFQPDVNFNISAMVPVRKQLGFLHNLEDVLKQLASFVLPFIPELLKTVLYMLTDASRTVNEDDLEPIDLLQRREIRQLSVKRLGGFFKLNATFDYAAYLPYIFEVAITPRIPKFSVENSQAPTALMDLFTIWAKRVEYVSFFVDYDKNLLKVIFGCLSAKKVQNSVISAVLEIIEDILSMHLEPSSNNEQNLAEYIILPYVDDLLNNIGHIITVASESVAFGKDQFSKRQIFILSQIAAYVKHGEQARQLVDILLPSLKKPVRVVPEKTKADILLIMKNFIPLIVELKELSSLYTRYYSFISLMFSTLESRDCRVLLAEVLTTFSSFDPKLLPVVQLITELNSFSATRLDEPDFDRRLVAFATLTQTIYLEFTPDQWLPVLHNLIYFVQDPEEMSIRNNASFALTKFVDRTIDIKDSELNAKFHNLLTHVVFPSIRKGMRSRQEIIRVEFLTILAHAIKERPDLDEISDMSCLLAEGDDEASFFNNIHHIQLHRRIRSVTRLATECQAGKIKASNITRIFIPLLSHFIFESDTISDHNLINETVTGLGVISKQLPWGPYYGMIRQYLKLIPKKPLLEKILVRVVVALLEDFHFDLTNAVFELPKPAVQAPTNTTEADASAAPAAEPEDEEEEEEIEEESNQLHPNQTLASQLSPSTASYILNAVTSQLLPDLQKYLTKRDDENVNVRVPVALAITKLLKCLPVKALQTHLPGMLTSICQTLRSRSQETRDTTRSTLVKIATFLGPTYFSFIVKELKGALQRGYQLHVLGYTLHSILVHMVPELNVGDIDYCLEPVIEILIEDVFGEVGIEKETQEITNKMKEAKTHKSFESFELLGRIIRFKSIGVLLVPFKEIMVETENGKVTRKIDESLRRISAGINNNPQFEPKEILIFCHGLISQNLKLSQTKKVVKKEKTNLETNFTVVLGRNPGYEKPNYFNANAHRFVEFGLSILLSALKRSKFDVKCKEHLEMLDPFVDVVGNSTYSKHQKVIILSLRTLSILCKIPLPSLTEGLPVIVKRVFQIIKGSSTTHSELVQSCFKLLTIAIRDNNSVNVTEKQLAFVLDLVRPDLEEPERQSITFSLIKAIISRKFIVEEVYDIMKVISEIMVTSQSSQVRELCRHVYLQFLLDYPQGKGRLRNQMNFLVKNLDYVYESGRQSVMEMLNVIFSKFADQILMEYAEMFFLSLVMSMVNDESNKCREMAGVLIKNLLLRMDTTRLENIFLLLNKWLEPSSQQNLQRASIQVYGLIIDSFDDKSKKYIPETLGHIKTILEYNKQNMSEHEENDEEADMDVEIEWETGYFALSTFTKLIRKFPLVITQESSREIWNLIISLLLHPHSWIRLSTARLFGIYFTYLDPKTMLFSTTGTKDTYLRKSVLLEIAKKLCLQLKSEYLSEDLGTQLVKNAFFIGKCFYHNGTRSGEDKDSESESEAEAEPVEEGEGEEANGDSNRNRALFWLFKKLSFVARSDIGGNKATARRIFIFQWFAAMASFIKPEELQPYLIPIVSPIYRTVNDETSKGKEAEDLRALGQEVLDFVRKQVGTTVYHETYNQIRQRVVDIRRERKAKRSFQAITDPEAHAKRKIQKNEMKKNSRKNKTSQFANSKERLTVIKNRNRSN
ncbi:U3 snoRNP protein [Basidiobolus ranarum]|uniref:U3 snoRNP protein n=1 Tax=Basidiobolus ranarum TaxID=34480 RepID=A0ABR2W827_9FUNG